MLTTGDERIEMFFPIKWKYEKFSSIKSAMPITMEWEIRMKENIICQYSKQFNVSPFQEDPYSVYWELDTPDAKDYVGVNILLEKMVKYAICLLSLFSLVMFHPIILW